MSARRTVRPRAGSRRAAQTDAQAPAIHYVVHPVRPQTHCFEVRLTIDEPGQGGQRLALPAWIPGSYMIREFAKNIVSIRATRHRRAVALTKLDKHTWETAPLEGGGPLVVSMQVFAHDLSVRGAWLDTQRGFFNGASVFLRVLGREEAPVSVTLLPPVGAAYRTWRVATSMRVVQADRRGFGRYRAEQYDELIDHPVEIAPFADARFLAQGVPHRIVITGRHEADLPRLQRDLKAVCEYHLKLFGTPAPIERYVFLINAVGEGYGGLEHRASTALICARDELPQPGRIAMTDGYRTFLGLASHEYFHTWNVKRIKPAAFTPYDLDRENHSTLLWAFEGITSYYDDLALVRTGLIDRKRYLESIAHSITSLARTPGRRRQSVAESSWDAWIKYYRQDENTPNAAVNYYLKGALIALCLDLTIRTQTKGRCSLDDVMRAMWREYGQSGVGVPEDGVEQLVESVTGLNLRAFFDRAVRGVGELPIGGALASVGIEMHWRAAQGAQDRGGVVTATAPASAEAAVALGMRTTTEGNEVKVAHVLDGGAAQAAGIAAGDTLVAIDRIRATAKNYERMVGRLRPGMRRQVALFRRDELLDVQLTVRPALRDTCDLQLPGRSSAALDAWLGKAR